jgi:Domain of unknown function (DUF4326)
VPRLERKAGRKDLVSNASLRRAAVEVGNPFVLGRDGSRDEVIGKYRAWIVSQPTLMSALHELRGKDLIFCAPESCLADVLEALANPKREG